MKSWEPEDIFKKADFPSKKTPKKAGKKQSDTAPDATPRKPEAIKKPVPPRADAGQGTGRLNGSGTSGGGSVGRNQPPPPRNLSPPKSAPIQEVVTGGELNRATWQPEQIDTADKNVIRSRKAETPPGQGQKETKPAAGRVFGAGPPGAKNSGAPEASSGGVVLPVRLMQETVLADPELAIRYLRRWYWEKWPPTEKVSGVRTVPPHDRLQIVLMTLGAKVQQYIYRIMSPVERGKFNEVATRNKTYSPATVNLVCREFMPWRPGIGLSPRCDYRAIIMAPGDRPAGDCRGSRS